MPEGQKEEQVLLTVDKSTQDDSESGTSDESSSSGGSSNSSPEGSSSDSDSSSDSSDDESDTNSNENSVPEATVRLEVDNESKTSEDEKSEGKFNLTL